MYVNAARLMNRERQNIVSEKKEAPILISDKLLVARAQTGDPWASEELVERYQEKAYAIAYNMCCGNSEQAKEITQEAFLRAFRGLKNFRGESSFYTWFYRILLTTGLDWKRRQSRWDRIFFFWRRDPRGQSTLEADYKEYPEPQEQTNPMKALNNKELAREIRKALRLLPVRQRTAFQLKVLHGMKIIEIARIMGTAEGTVKSHLFRATHFLRNALQEWDRP